MISVMTNQGALEVGRSLSGGSRFLAWEAALLADPFPNDIMAVASLDSSKVEIDGATGGSIDGKTILYRYPCTGSLPVKVSTDDPNGESYEAMAVDFDFNGQVPIEEGNASSSSGNGNTAIEYQAVVALARRYAKYTTVSRGNTYSYGDRVWMPYDADPKREHAYICLTDNFEYEGVLPSEDTANWLAIDTAQLVKYPGEPDCYSDPLSHDADGTAVPSDIIPFFVTSYDESVKMANGMEWEYKIRVFLDNVVTKNLSNLEGFSQGGLQANGSVTLTFLASVSELCRAIRDKVSSAT